MPLVSQSGQRTGGNAHQDDMCEIRGETDLKSYKEERDRRRKIPSKKKTEIMFLMYSYFVARQHAMHTNCRER